MKTVNFLEAHKLNETKRVRVVGEKDWYAVKSLHKKTTGWGISCITAQWEAEADKIEFICKWDTTNQEDIAFPWSDEKGFEHEVLKLASSGVKTKVTIEVLE